MLKPFFFIIICISFVKFSSACQCPITTLNQAETQKYDIVFKGKITSVKLLNERSEATFTINELYKGAITKTFTVLFNNLDECKIDLMAGDEWIIYTNFKQVNKAQLDFCSRSRKYIKNTKEDFFAVTTGISYDEELRYLQTTLGLHKSLVNNTNVAENRNILPNTNQFIIFIVCSIIGILFFYWLVNRFLK